MKKTFMLILALMLITVLTACGGNPESKTTAPESTASPTAASPTGKSEPSGALPPEFVVMIYSESSADFHVASQKISSTDFYKIEYDNYAIDVNKRDNNELKCSLYRQKDTERTYIGDCEYLVNEYETIICVPTVVLGIEEYNFNSVSEYSLYDGNEKTKYSAAEVAINEDGTPADIVDESQTSPTEEVTDTASADYANITFISDEGNELIITEVDAQGYPVSMSFNGNAIVFDSVSSCSENEEFITALLKWSTEGGSPQAEFIYIRSSNSIILKGGHGGEYKAVD